jgi:hypothetical protein
MATSGEILSFLDVLDEVGTDLDYVQGYVRDIASDEPETFRFREPADVEDAKRIRAIVAHIVQASQGPSRQLTDDLIRCVVEILGEEDLDRCFTRLELQMIPSVVKRWKELRALRVVLLPGEKVTAYLRQATACYLYGLPTAAAILCRAVLQFALEETIPTVGGVEIGRVDRQDWLMKLINLADKTRTLPTRLVTKAHRIREKGNEAAHSGGCSETRALTALKEAGEVLAHLYGTPKKI